MTDVAKPEASIRWPGEMPGSATDWFEFSVQPEDDEYGELLRVRVNVSFMLSSWKCIFGQGCPGVLVTGAMEDRGCCQIGVGMAATDDDYKRVRSFVSQLTEEDLDEDLLVIVRSDNGRGWRWRDNTGPDGGPSLPGYDWHTTVVDGACVLANRSGGSTGKLGCSLHVLANRLGLHPSETKPDICWQIPIGITKEYDSTTDQTTMTVDGSRASFWGHTDPTDINGIGWWCLETPDAYVIGNKKDDVDLTAHTVYRTNEFELRKLMGDRAYDVMREALGSIVMNHLSKNPDEARRVRMPGEAINGGRPLIPIMVTKRMHDWNEADDDMSKEALSRSVPYMHDHGVVPDGFKLPRRLRPLQAVESTTEEGAVSD